MQQKIKKFFTLPEAPLSGGQRILNFFILSPRFCGCFPYLKHNIKQLSGHLLSTLKKHGDFLSWWRGNGIPRGFAVPQSGMARAQSCCWGSAWQLDGNGGMRVAWAWRLHKTYKTYKTYAMMMGASCDTPWVCSAAVWNGSGKDVPLG